VSLDELLRASADVADPSTEELARGRTALLRNRRAAARRHMRRVRHMRHVRHVRHRSTVLVLATAAVVAALIALPTLAIHGHRPAGSAAAAVLHSAADAAHALAGGWPDARYWHSVSDYSRDGRTVRRETWIAHHGESVLKDAGVATGILSLGATDTFPAGGTSLTWDDLYTLPTEPVALAKALRADIHGAGADDDAELFTIVGDLLRESPASPALRSALYDVAATIPGVRLLGTVTDRAGRAGTAVERDLHQYVIDTSDGRLLEEREAGFVGTYRSQGPAASAPAPTTP
jgi:hypothetical protein